VALEPFNNLFKRRVYVTGNVDDEFFEFSKRFSRNFVLELIATAMYEEVDD